jgi:hypothetical protein
VEIENGKWEKGNTKEGKGTTDKQKRKVKMGKWENGKMKKMERKMET